jgi:hypothetical protein
MRLEPIAQPSTTPSTTPNTSARDRAIALLTQSPGVNPNNVSPEELSAIKPPTSTGQNDSIETSPSIPPSAESKVTEDPISTQYATLARKEKALRARAIQNDQSFKAKEAALLAKEEAFKAKETEYQSKYISKDKLSQDTLNTLAEAGLTYDQITELMLTSNSPERKAQSEYEKRLDAKLLDLERKQQAAAKAVENQQSAAYQQAIKQIKSDTTQLVTGNPEFETIKETNSVNDVVELIERTFKQDGILLSVEDAAKQVEDYLVEEAFKLTKLKKIQQRLTPAPKPAEVKQIPTKQPQTLKTLTNAVSSSGRVSSRDRAIAAFKGELK